MELKDILNRLADVITAKGTRAVRDELDALAEVAADTQPGAAAALTDWEGAEIARERAFAVIRHEAVRADAVARRDAATAILSAHGVGLVA